ncbi:MAG: hypothetical protein ACK559_10065, partial [bacterium]
REPGAVDREQAQDLAEAEAVGVDGEEAAHPVQGGRARGRGLVHVDEAEQAADPGVQRGREHEGQRPQPDGAGLGGAAGADGLLGDEGLGPGRGVVDEAGQVGRQLGPDGAQPGLL